MNPLLICPTGYVNNPFLLLERLSTQGSLSIETVSQNLYFKQLVNIHPCASLFVQTLRINVIVDIHLRARMYDVGERNSWRSYLLIVYHEIPTLASAYLATYLA